MPQIPDLHEIALENLRAILFAHNMRLSAIEAAVARIDKLLLDAVAQKSVKPPGRP